MKRPSQVFSPQKGEQIQKIPQIKILQPLEIKGLNHLERTNT